MSAAVSLRSPLTSEAATLTALCLRSKAHWGYDAAFMKACEAELAVNTGPIEAGLVRIAELDGKIAGVAELGFEGRQAEIEKLFVEPSMFGHGVGKALFEFLATEARQRGASVLLIAADPGAAGFYRRCGARDDGDIASGSIPGRRLPRLVFGLQG